MANIITLNSPATELGESVNTRAREDLAKRIKNIVDINGWTQTEAGRLCGQSQPRISGLLSGHLSRFSLDNLLKIATVLEYHSKDFPDDKRTTESALEMIEMFRALVDSRPIKAVYALATVGSKTLRGGEVVTSSTEMKIGGMSVARVGDLIRYPNGRESAIISGAGYAAVYEGKPLAIVGSHIENGDVIESSPQNDAKIIEYADDEATPGLLEPGYAPPTGKE
ncbi:XRE family transcriptional regulator [Herbaspirillum sp. RTI4]|uniref:PAAR domain-containing protein n=1 Tax=Herbaspirillum sp. RTI4 TaxID=3048640 RepID=UPI002AB43BE0|nr:PAAR domain-containing protein [Herbaspirillum sp. RTI4]MDY7576736.1 XRE family transcriptional regulator [Herbaspirillum sp. RTI4]MEA9983401.1 XRE family transcriptional regulator [Herbaspirillum sp. RTI4]